MRQSDKLKSF